MAALLAVAPMGANAGTQIGETFEPTDSCGAGNLILQSVSPGDQYAAPADGVITSWSYRPAATPMELKLKVGRPLGGNDFLIVGESGVETPDPNTLNSFRVGIPVREGDVIGFYNETAGGCSRSPLPGFTESFIGEDPAPGTEVTLFPSDGFQLDISANLETKKCKGKVPTMAGTAGRDRLVGTPGNDVIVGLGGKDKVKGLGGKDRLCGGKGKDGLNGGGGNDFLKGDKGDDRLNGGGGDDKCVGGKGEDVVKKCETESSI